VLSYIRVEELNDEVRQFDIYIHNRTLKHRNNIETVEISGVPDSVFVTAGQVLIVRKSTIAILGSETL
jgi:hypothetical protein